MPRGPCILSGDTNYALSMGGPSICPACDCGNLHNRGLAVKRMLGLRPPPTTNERAALREPLSPGTRNGAK